MTNFRQYSYCSRKLGYNVLAMFIPVKVLVIWIPRYFTVVLISIFWTLIWKLMLSDFLSLWTYYYQFRLICIDTDLVRSQPLNNKRKIMINVFIYFFIDLVMYKTFVLSAKCSIWLCLIDLWRSLMNIRNSSGPNTDQCFRLKLRILVLVLLGPTALLSFIAFIFCSISFSSVVQLNKLCNLSLLVWFFARQYFRFVFFLLLIEVIMPFLVQGFALNFHSLMDIFLM